MVVQPHAGEEWHDDACRNILGAIEAGATRVGHGIHAVCTPADGLPADVSARLAELGADSLCGLMRARGITAEVCLTSNLCIKSSACGRYEAAAARHHPLRLLLDAGVPCVLGSDDSGMWGDGAGTCLPEEIALALALGVRRGEVAGMMAHAFTISRAVPEGAKEALVRACAAWAADPGADLAALPKADMHSHLNGALPARWIDAHKGALEAPPLRPGAGALLSGGGGGDSDDQVDEGGNGCLSGAAVEGCWDDLDHFRQDYDKRGAIVKAAGVESLVGQVLAVAEDCAAANVRAVELSVTPWGPDHDVFLRWCAEGRRQAWDSHAVHVSFVVTAIRVLPADHSVAGGERYLASALRFCGCCRKGKGWPGLPVVAPAPVGL
jgi:hypothetical protein